MDENPYQSPELEDRSPRKRMPLVLELAILGVVVLLFFVLISAAGMLVFAALEGFDSG